MSSLHELMFSQCADKDNLSHLLGLTKHDFGRFRDIYVEQNNIVVHARCGGVMREMYEDTFERAENHPWFSHHKEREDDTTYCDFYFTVPDAVFEEYATYLNQGNIPIVCWMKVLETLEEVV